MIAALCALLYGYDRIVLSNERSASEGNIEFDGREANHQHSKSLDFEQLHRRHPRRRDRRRARLLLAAASLLRGADRNALRARDHASTTSFRAATATSRYDGHDGPLWCGECPKCHFVFLIFAPVDGRRTGSSASSARTCSPSPRNEHSFRELTGLAGQKPWECVGEILEAAACLYALTSSAGVARMTPIVSALKRRSPDVSMASRASKPRLPTC